jgi:hypothetical protein
MDYRVIQHDFPQSDLAPPDRSQSQIRSKMVSPEQWRVGIGLCTVYRDTIEVGSQAPPPKRNVA